MTPDFIRKYHIYRLLTKTNYNNCISKSFISDKLNQIYEAYHVGDKIYEGLLNNHERTIRRDIKDIETFFGLEVKHIRQSGYYLVSHTIDNDLHKSIFDKMELFLASHKEQQWSPYITTEQSSLNTDINILGLVKAIEQNKLVILTYKGWYDNDNFSQIKQAKVQPLHIKESNKAWYLLVYNKDIGIKNLCLDSRVTDLVITDQVAIKPLDFNQSEYFKDVFGILKDESKTEKIILKVVNHHFKYLETKPLHHSQKIIKYPNKLNTSILDYTDDAIFGELSVTLKPNFEFLIELFKYNLWVKVVEPKWLAQKIVKQHQFILEHYYADIQL